MSQLVNSIPDMPSRLISISITSGWWAGMAFKASSPVPKWPAQVQPCYGSPGVFHDVMEGLPDRERQSMPAFCFHGKVDQIPWDIEPEMDPRTTQKCLPP